MRNVCRISNAALVAVGLAGLGATDPAAAQVAAPVPIEQPLPEAPSTRFGTPMDGWVVVRYSILADGSTDDIVVVDKMPPQLNHRDSVSAVEEWVFEPATADGEPIDWHNNEFVIAFRSETVPAEPTPLFVQAYQEAQALADEGDLEGALRRNERMLTTSTTRLIEIGLAQVQAAGFHLRLGDSHAAYAAIARATDPRIPTVQGNDLYVALQYRNALELQLGDLIAAAETWERRNAIEPVPADDLVAVNIEAVRQALSDGSTVVRKARISDDLWRRDLQRRTFAISELSGAVEAIHVECNRRTADLEYAADSEWSLPDSWGSCSVAVEGRDDTEFEFYEFQ